MASKGIRELKEPGKAKFVCGILFSDFAILEQALRELERNFGETDISSIVYPFDITDYYAPETGKEIKRLFISFSRLVRQDRLADLKILCQKTEFLFARNRMRAVNIDPGLVTAERLVLATSKNFTHRIYIGKGVHADLTLIYQGNTFNALPWTFADYRREDVIEFWNLVRAIFMRQRNVS